MQVLSKEKHLFSVAGFQCFDGEFKAGLSMEFAEQAGDVFFDGAGGIVGAGGNLLIGFALAD